MASRIWKVLYWSALAVIFALAARARFSLPLEPLVDPDIFGYLGPALAKLNGAPFTHMGSINVMYPGALFLLLRVFPDFRAITIFHHLLGLGAGVFFILSWNRLASFFPKSRVNRAVHFGIGLFGAAIYLLSNAPIMLELDRGVRGVHVVRGAWRPDAPPGAHLLRRGLHGDGASPRRVRDARPAHGGRVRRGPGAWPPPARRGR